MKLKIMQPESSRIEMMPLIDSFFLILVYFIYAFLSMSVHKGVPLDLPKASTARVDPSEYHSVSVDRSGGLFFDKVPVTKIALKEKLDRHALKSSDTAKLYISGDEQAPYGSVVYVLNLTRELGIQNVWMETNAENSQ